MECIIIEVIFFKQYLTGHQIYSHTISSFYKGTISKGRIYTIKDYQLYTSLPGLVIQESKEEYYDSIKDESYPVCLQTVRRGRAVIFITGGNEMQYRTDLDLLRLFASLSIQFWLIYDPDVDVINFYLKELGQIMEQDTVDYCFVTSSVLATLSIQFWLIYDLDVFSVDHFFS